MPDSSLFDLCPFPKEKLPSGIDSFCGCRVYYVLKNNKSGNIPAPLWRVKNSSSDIPPSQLIQLNGWKTCWECELAEQGAPESAAKGWPKNKRWSLSLWYENRLQQLMEEKPESYKNGATIVVEHRSQCGNANRPDDFSGSGSGYMGVRTW